MWINNPHGEEGKADLTRREKVSKEEKDLEKRTTSSLAPSPQK